MMIAIEGAPGVGKSTVAAALGAGGAFVIPEVNRLFARPDPEPPRGIAYGFLV
jgi:broad-specificity NMP kinase